jgi:hypothetical protein
MTVQYLTITLDGITAADYLAWVRDPEPAALDSNLHAVTVQADMLGDVIEATLAWRGSPPAPSTAAPAAGFPITPEVACVEARVLAAAA